MDKSVAAPRALHLKRTFGRGYLILVDIPEKSALNVMNGDRIVRCKDQNAIMRFFRVGSPLQPLWHSVESNCHRYSLGLRLPDQVVQQYLHLATST